MPIQTRYLFSAAMDVDPTREGLFNEVYDGEHVPLLLKVPGVIAVARFKRQELTMVLGGERKTIADDGARRRAQDDRGRAGTPLQRALRGRGPRSADERPLGEGGGPGALARPGAPVHAEPPPRPLPSHLVRSWHPAATASS